MLGDVLRLSWSISLGSLLPSSLRLRPSKLSRSEGDCGRGSSCCRKGGPFFSLFFFLASPTFGASLAQNPFPLPHTTVPRDEYSCSSPPPCHVGVPPLSPHSQRLPSSQSCFPPWKTPFLPQVSISSTFSPSTAKPKSLSSTSSHPPSHLLLPH